MNPFCILLAFIGLPSFADAADTRAVRPNVVILLTDDQGTIDANCYDSTDIQTPNIDKQLTALHDAWEKGLKAK